jgi:hypothetical protein
MLNSQAVDLKGKSHLNRQILHGKDDYPSMGALLSRSSTSHLPALCLWMRCRVIVDCWSKSKWETSGIRIWLCSKGHSRPDSSSSINVLMSAP